MATEIWEFEGLETPGLRFAVRWRVVLCILLSRNKSDIFLEDLFQDERSVESHDDQLGR